MAQPQLIDFSITGMESTPDSSIEVTKNISLDHDENTFTLKFAANAYSDPSNTAFQYRLVNYDPIWVSGESRGTARFVNVPWGNYQFEVQATNGDNEWSATKSVNINISPPWWATWWAYVCYGLAAFMLLRGYIYYRSRALLLQNAKLEQTVEQRTKELSHSLTSLKETQTQLIHSEKMASLGQVTSGIAHEIQNPLNFVNNFSDVSNDLIDDMLDEIKTGNVDEATSLAKTVKQNLSRILHHGNRADAIVRSMMNHSRTVSGQKELTSINTLVEENLRRSYNLIKDKERFGDILIQTNLDESIARILIARQEIGKVIYNILNNALFACYEMKRVSDEEYKPVITVITSQSEEWTTILIEDNGIGISEENMEKIFLPFFSTRSSGEGTGLGLSLAYDIVKSHGGKIEVESVANQGASFHINLSRT